MFIIVHLQRHGSQGSNESPASSDGCTMNFDVNALYIKILIYLILNINATAVDSVLETFMSWFARKIVWPIISARQAKLYLTLGG